MQEQVTKRFTLSGQENGKKCKKVKLKFHRILSFNAAGWGANNIAAPHPSKAKQTTSMY
jgi:hypothetical protein